MAVVTWGAAPRYLGSARPIQLGHGRSGYGKHRLEALPRSEQTVIRHHARAYNTQNHIPRGMHRMAPRKFPTLRRLEALDWLALAAGIWLSFMTAINIANGNEYWFSLLLAVMLLTTFAVSFRRARKGLPPAYRKEGRD